MSSETTAAATGAVGTLRFDPMAMLPFCGYNMGDYWQHWLTLAQRPGVKLPKVFYVNWFRKNADGKFIWPGFGENSRVLAWIFRRCEGSAGAVETEIGLLPPVGEGGIDISDLDVTEADLQELLSVDASGWKDQIPQIHTHYAKFGKTLPAELQEQLRALEQRLS
jgi:phosphoenolpyruvate carboxykinase (GTP)